MLLNSVKTVLSSLLPVRTELLLGPLAANLGDVYAIISIAGL